MYVICAGKPISKQTEVKNIVGHALWHVCIAGKKEYHTDGSLYSHAEPHTLGGDI